MKNNRFAPTALEAFLIQEYDLHEDWRVRKSSAIGDGRVYKISGAIAEPVPGGQNKGMPIWSFPLKGEKEVVVNSDKFHRLKTSTVSGETESIVEDWPSEKLRMARAYLSQRAQSLEEVHTPGIYTPLSTREEGRSGVYSVEVVIAVDNETILVRLKCRIGEKSFGYTVVCQAKIHFWNICSNTSYWKEIIDCFCLAAEAFSRSDYIETYLDTLEGESS